MLDIGKQEFRVGVDIGGTFTDIVVIGSEGAIYTKKVSSSVDNYARSIVQGLKELLDETDVTPPQITEVIHGTTVGSNAILELKGAKTGLITTKGFRDVLEIRTLRMPRLYDMSWEKPRPLVERHLRFVVEERVDAHGNVLIPLDESEVEAVVDRLLALGVEAICVCLLNSYTNPAHELLIKDVIVRRAPHVACCISYEVLPEIKEYERTSTTAINAYVMPIMARYLTTLQHELQEIGIRSPLLLMQSNGGLATAKSAIRMPANIIESGPAGGVVGAQSLSRSIDLPSVITFDMGGTTAKASIVEAGALSRASEYSVGGGMMVGSRLLNGAGYLLKLPAIDLAEVGAGGGSIVRMDAGGAIQVGPHSAGSTPGPVCYGMGGEDPTITDANVILGNINPEHLVSGEVKLDAALAHKVFKERVARPLGLSVEDAAFGAYQIAAANMIRAIKAVSTERGRDPSLFSLFAFGGNGPIFGASMARSLKMKRVVVPPSPGVFSSFGLLFADLEHHYSRSYRQLLAEVPAASFNAVLQEMQAEAEAQVASDGYPPERIEVRRQAAMHYRGQTFELLIPIPDGPLDAAGLLDLQEAFGREHELTYGHRAGKEEPVEIVTLQVVGRGVPEEARVPRSIAATSRADRPASVREVYFGPEHGWLTTPVLARADLAVRRAGPIIVEEYDATCVVPPHSTAVLDTFGNIIISLE